MLPADIASPHQRQSGRKHFMDEDHTFLPPALSSYSIALLNEKTTALTASDNKQKPSEVTGIYDLDFPNSNPSKGKIRDKLSAHFRKGITPDPTNNHQLETSHNNSDGPNKYDSLHNSRTNNQQETHKQQTSNTSYSHESYGSAGLSRRSSRHNSINMTEVSGGITHNHSKDDVMDQMHRNLSSHSSTSGGIFDRADNEVPSDNKDRFMPPVKRVKSSKRFGRLLAQDSRRVVSTSAVEGTRPGFQPYSTMIPSPSSNKNSELDLSFLNKEKELELRKRIEIQKEINEQEGLGRRRRSSEGARDYHSHIDGSSMEKLKFASTNERFPLRKPLSEIPPSNSVVSDNVPFRKPKLPKAVESPMKDVPKMEPKQADNPFYNPNKLQNIKSIKDSVIPSVPNNTEPKAPSDSAESQHQAIQLPDAVVQSIKSRKSDKTTKEPNTEVKKKTIIINGITYEKLELLGRGGTSKVYKVKSSSDNRLYAIKKVTFDQFDDACIRGFKGEIDLLLKLKDNDRVVQLIDYAIGEGSIYLVMECGEIDFSHVLHNRLNSGLDVNFVKFNAIEMFKCVQTVHQAEIVHSDLKPANFLYVKGVLKIIDFGIACAVPDHTANIYRDALIGTPSYMAPETLIDMNESLSPMKQSSEQKNTWKVGKPSDVWSCGCIIYQMIYGKPPYGKYSGNQRIMAIMNPQVKIQYPSKGLGGVKVPLSAIELMQNCLSRYPNDRWTVEQCLESDFLKPKVVNEGFIRDLVHSAVNFGYNNRVNGTGIITTDVYDKLVETVLKQIEELNFS